MSNSVRELSKVADGATSGHWKIIIHLIKFVLDTERYGLKIKPVKNQVVFALEGNSDSAYAEDTDTHISMYAFINYFCGLPFE
jgi:hypothetical protein